MQGYYHLTLEEVKAVILNAESDEQRLAFKVTFWHGLRATETVTLTGAQIQGGYIDVRRLKGSLHTRQPYIRHRDPALDECLALHNAAATTAPGARVFPNLLRIGTKGKDKGKEIGRFTLLRWFKKAAKKAGLPPHKCHTHCLKHSIGKASIRDAGIANTQQWLGHKNMSSTGIYTRSNDDEAAAAINEVFKFARSL